MTLTRKDVSRIPGVTPKNPAAGARGPGLKGLRPAVAQPRTATAPAEPEAPAAPQQAPAPLRKGMTGRLRGMGG